MIKEHKKIFNVFILLFYELGIKPVFTEMFHLVLVEQAQTDKQRGVLGATWKAVRRFYVDLCTFEIYWRLFSK